ncbi:hypothetical protein DFS34DRAFT_665149 [Phlyctochytrium arcticum]|nr:hypothetical protein DFS34DRAFT_665149 [Phlyctochytrium arcticum]
MNLDEEAANQIPKFPAKFKSRSCHVTSKLTEIWEIWAKRLFDKPLRGKSTNSKRMALHSPIIRSHFQRALKQIILKPDESIAVAVGGETKSLALLHLLKEELGAKRLVAFSVDHGLQEGTTKEVEAVAEKVKALGIEHHSIKVDWSQSGSGFLGDRYDPPLAPSVLENPSTLSYWSRGEIARKRRYALLSQACRERSISNLFVAHTLDDQVRIGINRLKKNSGVDGLNGLHAVNGEVPNASALAARKVRLVRPLLSFTNAQAAQTCAEAQLTPNDAENPLMFPPTIDYGPVFEKAEKLNEELGDQSPLKALTRKSFAKVMEHMGVHSRALRLKVRPIIEDNTVRDPPTGTCFLQVRARRDRISSHWIGKPYIADRVLSSVIKWVGNGSVNPSSHIPSLLRTEIVNYFNFKAKRVTGGGVLLSPPRASQTGAFVWIASRCPLPKANRHSNHLILKHGQRGIWDQRFLFALDLPPKAESSDTYLGTPYSDLSFVVRPFMEADYKHVLARMRALPTTEWGETVQHAVNHYWKKMPSAARETIPCIALLNPSQPEDTSHVVAIPSLSVNLEPQLLDIKFSFANHYSGVEKDAWETEFRLIDSDKLSKEEERLQTDVDIAAGFGEILAAVKGGKGRESDRADAAS